jgi:hypothetical protein
LTLFFCSRPKSYAWPAAVRIDELNARPLKGASYNFKSRSARFIRSGLQLVNRYNPNAC